MLGPIKLRDVSCIDQCCLMLLESVTLSGTHVELVPLSIDHSAALAEAVQDGEFWRLCYTTVPAGGDMEGEILRRLDLQVRGSTLAFAVLDGPVGTPVDMTSYLNVDAATPRLEIGATWYAGRIQRTPLNMEAKLLLLEHTFGPLSCLAVEFRTHFMKAASWRAIERLGSKLDGILRHDTLPGSAEPIIGVRQTRGRSDHSRPTNRSPRSGRQSQTGSSSTRSTRCRD